MMGGIGSGGPGRSGRTKAEACRSIDVNYLHKMGCLRPGLSAVLNWTRGAQQVGSINLCPKADALLLRYRVRIADGEWQEMEETVSMVRVRCPYGSARPYFVCPGIVNGVACGRRVVKLYGPGRYFLCRHCCRLAHASQNEDEWDRAIRRASKIRRRLGGEPGVSALLPPKPKGMWWPTYDALGKQVCHAEICAEQAFLRRATQLLSRIEARKREWR